MTSVFISGSISIRSLPDVVKAKIDDIMNAGNRILIGDAPGVDALVMQHISAANYTNVLIFYSGYTPRNSLGNVPWYRVPVAGVPRHEYHRAKDRAMTDIADYGFAIWDGSSRGTKANIDRLTAQGKLCWYYHMPSDGVKKEGA